MVKQKIRIERVLTTGTPYETIRIGIEEVVELADQDELSVARDLNNQIKQMYQAMTQQDREDESL